LLYARRKGWTVDRVEVKLAYAKPRIELELILGGDLTAEQESRLREVADRCPVHRALKGEVEISEKR
jgi:putative redox protein